MNRKALVVVAAVLFGAGLTATLPGVGVQAARAANPNDRFHVESAARHSLDGQDRIIGYVENDSGDAADQLRVVVSGLDSKGHVISRVVRTLDDVVPAGDRIHFDVQIPSAPSYRVEVDRSDSFRAP